MRVIIFCFLAILIFSTSCQKAETTSIENEKDGLLKDRLFSSHLEGPFVVSRGTSNEPKHQGEGLLWSGILLGISDCQDLRALRLEDGLIKTIEDHRGALVRFLPLGEYANGREVTLDGALGLYFGLSKRLSKCPEAREKWRNAISLHERFLWEHGNRLHENVEAGVVPEFTVLTEKIFSLYGLRDSPTQHRANLLQGEVLAWTLAVRLTKASCYRVHLSYLTLESLRSLGYELLKGNYRSFCAITWPMKIPLIDGFCGDMGKLKSYLDSFQINEWEYRHQRCGSYERPDGSGYQTPGLDYLVAHWLFTGGS